MARTARVKKDANGTAHYHLMSQANDKKFLFEEGRIKDSLIDALKRAAEFSGIGLEAYAGMDNHFHVVCEVVRTDEPVPEAELIRRVGVLKGAAAAEELAEHWAELREAGLLSLVEAAQKRLRERMNDISEFMKTFKEAFNVRFKRERGYTGSIWSGRFKSTRDRGRALPRDLPPLRVPEPGAGGDREARRRLRLVLDRPVGRPVCGDCPRLGGGGGEADEAGGADRGREDIRQLSVRDGRGVCAWGPVPIAMRDGEGGGGAGLRDARLAARETGGERGRVMGVR
jgi:REP element-mobilizing transposase RayT